MKLLIVTEVFYPEDGLINDFVRELQRTGNYEIEVLTQHPSYPQGKIYPGYQNDNYRVDEENGIRVHRFKVIEGYRDSKVKKILNYRAFVRHGKKIGLKIGRKYDHILIYQTGPLTLALPAIAIKKRFGPPVTIWTFDIWPQAVYSYGIPKVFPVPQTLNWIINRVYRNCDNILVSSQNFDKIIQPVVPGKSILYAPNWLIPQDNKVSSIRLDPQKQNFTFTGNISIAQNLDQVVLGWKAANLPNAWLHIVGDGSYLETLKGLQRKEQIPNITFYGRQPANEIADILNQSTVLILPLKSDSGIEATEPYKLQSYLTSGKPILGILNGSGREIIETYQLGICADPSDIDQIAASFTGILNFLYANPDVAQSATNLLKTRFNKQSILQRVEEVLNKK